MKFILINKEDGVFNDSNPITQDDLFEFDIVTPPKKPNLTPVTTFDGRVTWEAFPIKKLKEKIVQKKEDILGILKSDILYVIDGDLALGQDEHIVVPESGLNIRGYSFDASRIGSYGIPNHSIFKSDVGGSGNLVIHDIAFTCTGEGSGVFDIIDGNGSHALEMVTVNFEGCKSIGKIDGYRQGTGITVGFYGCTDGLTFSGAWNGFKLTNTNGFGFGATGTLFKAGTNLTFKNRFFLDINVDIPNTSVLCDFSPTNFLDNKLLQINTTLAKMSGVLDAATNTSLLFPNITPQDNKALFVGNIGIINTVITPSGISSENMITATDNTDATFKGVKIGEVYVESSTGYFKTRLT
jgi:hypothetical protein